MHQKQTVQEAFVGDDHKDACSVLQTFLEAEAAAAIASQTKALSRFTDKMVSHMAVMEKIVAGAS